MVMSFFSVINFNAVVPFQVFSLVALPTLWLFSALVDIASRPALQAHIPVATPSYFNSLSIVPTEAHALMVRPKAMVPSVIIPTTTAISVFRPFYWEAPFDMFNAGFNEDTCPWINPVALPLSEVCSATHSDGYTDSTTESTSSPVTSPTPIFAQTSKVVLVGTLAIVLLASLALAAFSAPGEVALKHLWSSLCALSPFVADLDSYDELESTPDTVSILLHYFYCRSLI